MYGRVGETEDPLWSAIEGGTSRTGLSDEEPFWMNIEKNPTEDVTLTMVLGEEEVIPKKTRAVSASSASR